MTDFVEQSIKTYNGLSTETKPTAAGGNNIPNGSRFREIDAVTSEVKTFFYNISDDTWYSSSISGLTDTELRATPVPVTVSGTEADARERLNLYPYGAGTNGATTLTNANTAYPVPTTAPTGSYRISISNGSDSTIYIGYENSNANGIPLFSDDILEDDIGANDTLYAYCASAGKILTYSYKLSE